MRRNVHPNAPRQAWLIALPSLRALFMFDAGQGVAASPPRQVRAKVRELVPSLERLSVTYGAMDDFNSETDSDYTSYWRDWVCLCPGVALILLMHCSLYPRGATSTSARSTKST